MLSTRTIVINAQRHPDLCKLCRHPHDPDGPCVNTPRPTTGFELRNFMRHEVRFRRQGGSVKLGVLFDVHQGSAMIGEEEVDISRAEILGVGAYPDNDARPPWVRLR